MPAELLGFPDEHDRARPSHAGKPPVLLEILPGREGERLCVHRTAAEDGPQLRLVWERHAPDIGWYRLRSLELTRDQAGQLRRLLDTVDLAPPRRRAPVLELREGSRR